MTKPTPAVAHRAATDLRLHSVLLLCFALSGATGIVYEVLWNRMLTLVFGSTTEATGATLAVFMGGLALGGWLAGRRADQFQRPLRAYALLEGGIGLCALLAPTALASLGPLARGIWQASGGANWAMGTLRLAAAATLLPPTVLMGATLPILGRWCVNRSDALGARLGTLYGINTLGAAVGAFLSGFVLISLVGVSGAARVAALVNFALAAVVWLLDRSTRNAPANDGRRDRAPGKPTPLRGTQPGPQTLDAPTSRRSAVSSLVLFAFGLSGAVALIYEVAWTRALLMLIGSSMQAFAIMLTTFLIGLQLGALAAAPFVDRLRRPLVALAWVEASVGLGAWCGYRLFGTLPWVDLTLIDTPVIAARFGLASAVMLPTAVCLGALFPLALRACKPNLDRVGRTVGDLYAANTVGAILGSLLASFILLPWLGTQTTLRLCMAGNVLLGLGLLAAAREPDSPEPNLPPFPKRKGPNSILPMPLKKGQGGSAGGVRFSMVGMALLLLLVVWSQPWDMVLVTLAQTTRREAASYREIYHEMPWVSEADFVQQMHQQQQLLYAEDGRASHVAVIRNAVNTSLITNGHSDGSDNTDMPTQILLGALPMLLRQAAPPAPRVAVLGWGTGVTAGVVEQLPIERLTGLELEPKVLRASDLFRKVNRESLRDPHTHMVVEDGRCTLLADPTAYDIILSEPSNVWQSGVCSLFTEDFFRICRARLRPGGLFAQWIGYGSIPPDALKGVLAAIRQVFPTALLFRVDAHDAVLLAAAQAFRPDAALLRARLQAAPAPLRTDLGTAGISTPADIMARLIAGSAEIDALIGNAEPNTDDNARLECAVSGVGGLRSYVDRNGKDLAAARCADPCAYFDLSGLSAAEAAALRQQVQQIVTSQPAASAGQ